MSLLFTVVDTVESPCLCQLFSRPPRTVWLPPLAAVPVAAANSMQFRSSVSTMSVSLLNYYSFSHELTTTLEDGNNPHRTSKGIRWCSIGHVPHDDAVTLVAGCLQRWFNPRRMPHFKLTLVRAQNLYSRSMTSPSVSSLAPA